MTFLEALMHARASNCGDDSKLRDPKYWPCYNCCGFGRVMKPVDPENYDERRYVKENCNICNSSGKVTEEEFLRWFLRKEENRKLLEDFMALQK